MRNLTLTKRSPSPSAVNFTISSKSAPRSLVTRLLSYLAIALRAFVLATCSGAFFLQCKRPLRPSSSTPLFGVVDLQRFEVEWEAFISSLVGPEFSAGELYWWVVPLLYGGLIWFAIRRYHVEEALLVIRGLGVQMSTSSSLHLAKPTTRFIPTSQIQDVFIHEAFIGFEVRFYLAVIVEGEDKAVVVFPKLLPRREMLEEVWRGSRAVLQWDKN